jgi:anthranilate phosphoribosyltransferase
MTERAASDYGDDLEAGAAFRDIQLMLARLMRGEDSSFTEASELISLLLKRKAKDAQVAALLVALSLKGETVEEIVAMSAGLGGHLAFNNTPHSAAINIAGTGASRARTFNVSTAAALVAAGAGLPIVKSINPLTPRRQASPDLLTALGIGPGRSPEVIEFCLKELGICFAQGPPESPPIAQLRRVAEELGVPTTFNLIGSLIHAKNAPRHLVGVWHAGLMKPCARALVRLGGECSWVVHGMDGLDEITLADKTIVAEALYGNIRLFEIGPEDFGLETAPIDHLRGGDSEVNAKIIRAVLEGKRRDEARSLVVMNAAACLLINGAACDFREAARLAEESIDAGLAHAKLEELIKATNN